MGLLCIQQNTINTERDAQSLLQSNNEIMLKKDKIEKLSVEGIKIEHKTMSNR